MRLEQDFGLAATKIMQLVEPAGRAGEIDDDKAAVTSLPGRLDASDDAPLHVRPTPGGVGKVEVSADLVGVFLGGADRCVVRDGPAPFVPSFIS